MSPELEFDEILCAEARQDINENPATKTQNF